MWNVKLNEILVIQWDSSRIERDEQKERENDEKTYEFQISPDSFLYTIPHTYNIIRYLK